MNNNICPECLTENEPQYPYCKNCGAPLKTEAKTEPAPQPVTEPVAPPVSEPVAEPETDKASATAYTPEPNNEPYSAPDFSTGYISGIPEVEYRLFIGKNSEKIIPKFTKMELTGTKNSWCWPAAILGFFCGPLGSALWFFYRKMYKPAFILAIIGTILSIVTGILTFDSNSEYITSFVDAWTTGNLESILNSVEDLTTTIPTTIAGLIEDISTLVTCAVTGIFGYNIYKNHCFNKISEYKTYQADPTHYRLGLTYLGGTSGGMLALGIIIMLGADYIISFITTLLSLVV